MRRSGSAAPHSSWSPTVNAPRYSPPIASLRRRPTGISSVPVTAAGVSSRDAVVARVGDDAHPIVRSGEHPLDLGERDVPSELDRQRLASGSAWRRCARRSSRSGSASARGRGSCWSPRCPSIPRGSCRCPGPRRSTGSGCRRAGRRSARSESARRAGCPRPRGRCRESPNAGSSSSVFAARCASPICCKQLAHVLRAGAGRRLVGHARHPLDQVALEEARERHHHEADRAVAADVVLHAPRERRVDDVAIDGIEDDHRVVGHPQRRGGIDPVAVPARGAQLRKHVLRVVAALAGDDRVERGERGEIGGVARAEACPCRSRGPCRPRWRWRRTPGRCDRSRARPASAA